MKNLTNIDEKIDAVLQSWDAGVPQQPTADFNRKVFARIEAQRSRQRRRMQLAVAASVLWVLVNVSVMQVSLTGIRKMKSSDQSVSNGYETLYNEYFGSQDTYDF